MTARYGHAGVLDSNRKNVHVERHGAFTQTHDGCLNSMAFVSQGDRVAVLHAARWDTGSNYTYIDRCPASALDPEGGSADFVSGVAGEMNESRSYTVDLQLPGGIRISNIEIGDLDLSSLRNCDAIIGMDIISKGKLIVDGKAGTFTFEI